MQFTKKELVLVNIVVGAMDSLTGILLLISPVLVLSLLFIPNIPQEAIYLRFIGAFVAAVGFSYLIAVFAYHHTRELVYFKALWIYTGAIRMVEGSFLLLAILLGSLHFSWGTVAITDLAVACLQIAFIKKIK